MKKVLALIVGAAIITISCLVWIRLGNTPAIEQVLQAPVVEAPLPFSAAPIQQIKVQPESVIEVAEEGGPGRIRGTVFMLDGGQAEEADVRLALVDVSTAAKPVRFLSAKVMGGVFVSAELPLGAYQITVSTEELAASENCLLTPSAPEAELSFTLKARNVISGVVLNTRGEKIPGAKLYPVLHDEKPVPTLIWRAKAVETDTEGDFTLDLAESGRWSLYVLSTDYATLITSPIEAPAKDIEIILQTGTTVQGRVLHEGSVVEGARVTIAYQAIPGPEITVLSDDSGNFAFQHVATGEYEIGAELQGLVTLNAPVPLKVGSAPVGGILLNLAGGGIIEGRAILRETGAPIQDVTLRARHLTTKRFMRDSEPSDNAGNFRITNLHPGEYDVSPFQLPGRRAQKVRTSVQLSQKAENVVIEIEGGITIEGVVKNAEGSPVAGADVMGRAGSWNALQRSAQDGRFTLFSVPGNAEVTLQASTSDFASKVRGPIVVPEVGVRGIELILDQRKDGQIAGVVTDARLKPLRLDLQALQLVPSGTGEVFGDKTDEQGNFLLTGIPPGDYEIIGRFDSGTGMQLATVKLLPGQQLRDLKLVWKTDIAGGISGTVVDSDDNTVSCSLTLLREKENSLHTLSFARTTISGTFEFADLEPGVYEVKATGPGGIVAEVGGLEPGMKDVIIRLEELPKIEGKVVDAAGAPVGNFMVAAYYSGSTTEEPPAAQKSVAGQDGAFTLALQEGSYDVLVQSTGYRLNRVHVGHVEPGQPGEVIVRLQKGDGVEGMVVDTAGAPVGGASIYLGLVSQDDGNSGMPTAAHSDQDGKFSVIAPEHGNSLSLTAIHNTLGFGFTENISDGMSPIRIVIEPFGSLNGSVTNLSGGVEDTTVVITGPSGARSARLDASGSFSVPRLPAGTYSLSIITSAAPNGYPAGEVLVEAGQPAEVQVELGE